MLCCASGCASFYLLSFGIISCFEWLYDCLVIWLLAGTLRFNLDPFNLYEDRELWEALAKASLKQMLILKGEKLDMKVQGQENG